MTLTTDEIEALKDIMIHEPVERTYLAHFTGLDIRQLIKARILRHIDYWGNQLYKGENFPK